MYRYSGEASPIFGHANANLSVFIDCLGIRFERNELDNQMLAGVATVQVVSMYLLFSVEDNNNNNNNNNFIYTVNYPISNTAGINGRTVFMNILTGIYSHICY